jgi:hypothetical protein
MMTKRSRARKFSSSPPKVYPWIQKTAEFIYSKTTGHPKGLIYVQWYPWVLFGYRNEVVEDAGIRHTLGCLGFKHWWVVWTIDQKEIQKIV